MTNKLPSSAEEGPGVVRPTSERIYSVTDRTTPSPPLPRRGIALLKRIVGRIHGAVDRRTMSIGEFRGLLDQLGIQKGAVVMVHSSMDAIARRVPELSAV